MSRKKKLEDQAYQYIVKKIKDKELLPKEHIRELDVARDLDISRTPIRKAFLRLEADGYIENIPNKGAVITMPEVDITGFVERIEFAEIHLVHYLHRLEVQNIDFDASDLREVFDHLVLSSDQETLAFEEIEYEFWSEFLNYSKNQFIRSTILEVLRGLIPTAGQVRTRVVESRSMKVDRLESLLIYLEEGQFHYARRQIRILFNQLSMNVIQGV